MYDIVIVILSEIDSINFLITNIEILSNIYKSNCVQIKQKSSDITEILANIVLSTKGYKS